MILQPLEIQLKHVYISAEPPNTKIGLNNGTVGTILFLISTVYSNYTWKRAFLIPKF